MTIQNWTVQFHSDTDGLVGDIIDTDTDESVVEGMYFVAESDAENQAAARLIARAPALRRAVEQAHATLIEAANTWSASPDYILKVGKAEGILARAIHDLTISGYEPIEDDDEE